MSHRISLLALALVSAISPALRAQAPAPAANPYRVLNVMRESVKPGKGGAHDKLENAWAQAFADAKMPYGLLGMSAVTGPRETWYVSGFPSYAEMARMTKAFGDRPALTAAVARFDPQESEMLSDARGMVLLLRDDLSYGQGSSLATMRFMTVTRLTVRPGHVPEFVEARKMTKQAHETAHLSDSYSVYEATAGAPVGTFFVFVARKSLAELDDAATIHGPAYLAALGGEEGRTKMTTMSGNYLVSSQTDHFAFVPSQSVVSAGWAAADPSYWKLRTTPITP